MGGIELIACTTQNFIKKIDDKNAEEKLSFGFVSQSKLTPLELVFQTASSINATPLHR